MPGPHYQPDRQHPYAPAYVMTWNDVARVALDAGFSSSTRDPGSTAVPLASPAAVAVAIAHAESRFDATIVNPAGGATGLWQIYPGGRQYIDPRANAGAAYSKFKASGNRWTPWNRSGVYGGSRPEVVTYLIAAQNAVEAATGVNVTHQGSGDSGVNPGPGLGQGFHIPGLPSIPNPLHGIEAIGAFFAKLTEGTTWLRILFVLGGLGLLFWMLYALAGQTKVGRGAIRGAKTAAKKGAELAAVA